MHEIFEMDRIFHQPDVAQIINEEQEPIFNHSGIQSRYCDFDGAFIATGNNHSGNSSPTSTISGFSVSSSSVMTASLSSGRNSLTSGRNSLTSGNGTSSDTSSSGSDEDDKYSSSSDSSDGIIDLKPLVKKPDMSFAELSPSAMTARLEMLFGFVAPPVRNDIEASFAHGIAHNRLVEIEEMNEKAQKLSEVKFKSELKDEEDNSEDSLEAHVEMEVFLGVLEEKKDPTRSSPAILVNGGRIGEVAHLQDTKRDMKGVKRFGMNMTEEQFADWRKQFRKPHQDNDVSGEAEMNKRKRSAADDDEGEKSTGGASKRTRIEGS